MLPRILLVLVFLLTAPAILASDICRHPDWEYEHVVPVSTLSNTFNCSSDCLTNEKFMEAYSDLHNTLIVPLTCTEEQTLPLPFGRELRGAVARIYFYMIDQHRLDVDQDYYMLLLTWSQIHPVTDWERERNRILTAITGKSNYYVD